mmetsp:Transcript_33401/g.81095  ORF Transcript_33401/g.81095 Transcript_33401/m.81095 type:complete len:227 (-) Transcript_33401:153-833(-)
MLLQREGYFAAWIHKRLVIADPNSAIKSHLANRDPLLPFTNRPTMPCPPEARAEFTKDPIWPLTFRRAIPLLSNPQYRILMGFASNTINTRIVKCRSGEYKGTVDCPCGRSLDCSNHWIVCKRHAKLRRLYFNQFVTAVSKLRKKCPDQTKMIAKSRRTLRKSSRTEVLLFFTARRSPIINRVARFLKVSSNKAMALAIPVVGEYLSTIYKKDQLWRPPPSSPLYH